MGTNDSASECLSELDQKPRLDMEFDSEQTALDFYNMYGLKLGFSIRRESCTKSKSTGEMTLRIFVCGKECFCSKDKRDHLRIKARAQTRIGCHAQLGIKLNRKNNNFFVNHFIESHNHLFVMQDCAHILPSQHKITLSQAVEVELTKQSGIPLKFAFELMGKQASGREFLGYTKKKS